MITLMKQFFRDDRGATAIEYAIIAGGIALFIIAAVNGVGTSVNSKFGSVNTSLK